MARNSTPPKKRGPKAKPIDVEQVGTLARMQCTHEEMAAVMKLKRRMFIRRVEQSPALREVIDVGWASGRASIRRQQFAMLAEGNGTMAVWLGKQYLGQRDNLDAQLTGKDGRAIEVTVSSRETFLGRIAGIAERRRTESGSKPPDREGS
jgi:hypothetical protein